MMSWPADAAYERMLSTLKSRTHHFKKKEIKFPSHLSRLPLRNVVGNNTYHMVLPGWVVEFDKSAVERIGFVLDVVVDKDLQVARILVVHRMVALAQERKLTTYM